MNTKYQDRLRQQRAAAYRTVMHSRPRCRECNRHWREELEVGPKGRHSALECQPFRWHWMTLGHWSASQMAGTG
eukprot:4065900-Prymnesium_polylepis.1